MTESKRLVKCIGEDCFVQMPEEKHNNCEGCYAQDNNFDFDLCEVLMDDKYCQKTHMIYKKIDMG